MIENLLKEMGFFIDLVVDYDPHQVISNRIKYLKRNTFKHVEVVGLADVANFDDYPKETPKDTDVQEDSSYSIKNITSLMPYIYKLISAFVNITPLVSH